MQSTFQLPTFVENNSVTEIGISESHQKTTEESLHFDTLAATDKHRSTASLREHIESARKFHRLQQVSRIIAGQNFVLARLKFHV